MSPKRKGALEPIDDFVFEDVKSIKDLTDKMKLSGGFVAKKVGVACDILFEMIQDKDCLKILSFPSCLVATGTRGIIKELMKRRLFDGVITACGTFDQ